MVLYLSETTGRNAQKGKCMMEENTIPASVYEAVTTLLRPFGVNIKKLLQKGGEEKDEQRYVTIAEAERCFGLGRWTLGRLIRAGKISSCKMSPSKSGKVLIDRASLIDHIENCKRTAKGVKNEL